MISAERAYYENPALWEPQLYTGAEEERAQLTLQWLPQDVKSVLDAGCGNGVLTNRLQQLPLAIGIDRSFAALQWVQPPSCQADLATLPFADNAFDAVISTEVLEHLPQPIYRSVLDEMVRVTRRHLLISVPYCEDLALARVTCPACGCQFHRNYHMRRFEQGDIQNLFGHKKEVRYQRAAGVFEMTEPGAARVKRHWRTYQRRFGAKQSLFGNNLICPQCTYASPSRVTPVAKPSPAMASPLRLGPLVNMVVPAKRTYRWWLAHYCKES